jgi:hypothetical protein
LKRYKAYSKVNGEKDYEKLVYGAPKAQTCYAGFRYLRIQKRKNVKRQKTS